MSEEAAAVGPRRSTRTPKPIKRLRSQELVEPVQKHAPRAAKKATKKPRVEAAKKKKKAAPARKKKVESESESEEEEEEEEEAATTSEESESESEEEEAPKKKRGRKKKHAHVEFVPGPKALKELSDAQREHLESLSIDELKARLRENDMTTTGAKGVLQARVAHAAVHGVLGRCPTCFGGRLKRSVDGKVYCPGSYDDDHFVSCAFVTDSVVPTPWKAAEGKPL